MLRYIAIAIFLFAGICYAKDKRNIGIFNVVKFGNDPCDGNDNKNGTCYTEAECDNKGGKASGSCAEGYGVCCVFTQGCGDTVAENGTYFESSGSPTGQCNLKVCKCEDNICQLRLDFMTFVIAGPSTLTATTGALVNGDGVATGNAKKVADATQCQDDQFAVTSPGNPTPPVICGTNTNQHMYVDASESCNTLSFQLSATATVTRQWAIKVTQYACSFSNLAPSGCTQWFFGSTSGTIQSYNFAGGVHLANQNQLICIRRERNTCQVCYNAAAITDFRISGQDTANQMDGICNDLGTDGMGTDVDHVIIPHAEKNGKTANPYSGFCGGNLGFKSTGTKTDGSLPATVCSSRTPFQLRFISDAHEFLNEYDGATAAKMNHKGFNIVYNLNNC